MGNIQRNLDIADRADKASNERTGFVLSGGIAVDTGGNAVTISIDNATRTVTINSTVDYHIYSKNVRYVKSNGAETVTFDDTEGEWFFYFTPAGVLTASQTFSTDIISGPHVFVAECYWDATNKIAVLGGIDEAHGMQLSGAAHVNEHYGIGALVRSGLSPNTIASDESGALATHAQWGIDNGSISDEDKLHAISAIASTTGGPILYLSTANNYLRETSNSGYWFTTAGSGRAAYNNLTTGTLDEVDNGKYVWIYVAAIGANTTTKRVFAMPGPEQYANKVAATNGVSDGFYSLLGKINLQERRPLFAILIQTNDGYGNAVKSRVVTTSFGDYVDFRTDRSPSGTVGAATNHNALSGRSDPGTHPTLDAGLGNDQTVKMGDAAGSNKVLFVDSADATVASIDSDGNIVAPKLSAISSAGLVLGNVSGTACLTLGAGGGCNATFADGVNVNSGTLQAGTVDINGGAIDGTPIGATTPSTIAGTTISASGDCVFSGNAITKRFVDDLSYTNWMVFEKARTTGGVVQNNDQIGTYIFRGHDGTGYVDAALIRVEVDGTPGTNDMPGRIVFLTSPDGSTTPAEAMRISSDKSVDCAGVVTITNNTAATSSAGALRLSAGGLSVAGGGYFGDPVNIDDTGGLQVSGTKVVGAQGAAVADATGAGDVVAQLNALLARVRAHGLIAT